MSFHKIFIAKDTCVSINVDTPPQLKQRFYDTLDKGVGFSHLTCKISSSHSGKLMGNKFTAFLGDEIADA